MSAPNTTPSTQAPGAQSPGGESIVTDRLGRYRLIRCVSTGGMARVYEARRESLAGVAPKVAIKVILPEHANDAKFQQLFLNEAKIGSMLQHQNVVQIQDFDREGDVFYIVMDYVEGLTFRRAISHCKRNGLHIPLAVIAELGRQICEGLHYAHTVRDEHGNALHLVHRDVKPSNLILNPQGVVKVLDFGISKALIAAETRGAVKGTWGYMSPEQASGAEVSARADQYGVAAVLYELAMLQPLFPEKEPRVLRALMEQDEGARRAARLMGVHGPLAPVLVRALQRDPYARHETSMTLAQDLARLVPDPVLARDQVLQFQSSLLALDRLRKERPGKDVAAVVIGIGPAQPRGAPQAQAVSMAADAGVDVSEVSGVSEPSGFGGQYHSNVSNVSQSQPTFNPAVQAPPLRGMMNSPMASQVVIDPRGGLPVAVGGQYAPYPHDYAPPQLLQPQEEGISTGMLAMIGLAVLVLTFVFAKLAMRHLDINGRGAVTEEVLTDPLVNPDGATTAPPVKPDGATTTPPTNPDGATTTTTPPVQPDGGGATTAPPVNPDRRDQGGGSRRDRDREPDEGDGLMPGERVPDPPVITSGVGSLAVVATSSGETSPPIFVGGVEKRAGRYRDELPTGTYQIKVVCPHDSPNPGWAPVKSLSIEPGAEVGLRVDCDTKEITGL
ncbi:protein kinase [Myxococcota bacterium]|nr:protein kinase [Myxococcota bacterium]